MLGFSIQIEKKIRVFLYPSIIFQSFINVGIRGIADVQETLKKSQCGQLKVTVTRKSGQKLKNQRSIS